jgi:transcriptional regulator with XRE-family HTH domain
MGTVADVKLADLRRRRFLTQAQLAVAAGVAPATISNLERGVYGAPQLRVMKRIADVLRVEPSEVDEFRESLGLPPAPAQEG